MLSPQMNRRRETERESQSESESGRERKNRGGEKKEFLYLIKMLPFG